MRVEVHGQRLWFDVDGAALVGEGDAMRPRATVVLLHGGPGSFDHSYFKPEFARLARTAQVVYLDLPGHGRSDWGDPASWSFELCADAVADFCDTVGIEQPIVFGHSLGGCVALLYAIRHPGHARALVVQSAFARFDLPGVVEEFRRRGGDAVAAVVEREYGGDSESVTAEEWAPCWKLFGPHVPGDAERARTVVNAPLNPPGLEVLVRFDVLDRLGGVDCPALVCGGELDPITPVAAQREIAAGLPRGRLEIVSGAGHFAWLDAPDRYWPLLEGFVAESIG
jgi:proline iminopeptidase